MSKTFLLLIIFSVSQSALSFFGGGTNIAKGDDEELHNLACNSDSRPDSAWHISNLYNCVDKTLFIPYQLWTGMDWNGDKNANCMHKADSYFDVNGNSPTTIKGTTQYTHHDGKVLDVWAREKVEKHKQQFFICHEKGIGRVFDSRKPDRQYNYGRCKFPAGYGWQVGIQRKCTDTKIEITRAELDSENNLEAIEFKWWYQNSSGKYIHDHTYRYEVGYGMRNGWRQ